MHAQYFALINLNIKHQFCVKASFSCLIILPPSISPWRDPRWYSSLSLRIMNWESNLETASSPQDSISMQRVNIMNKVCLHFRERWCRVVIQKFTSTTILWVFYCCPIDIEGFKETNAGSTRGTLIGPFTQHNPELLWKGNRWYILFGALIMSWQSPQNWLSDTGQKTLINLIYSAELRPDDAVWFRRDTFPLDYSLTIFFIKKKIWMNIYQVLRSRRAKPRKLLQT